MDGLNLNFKDIKKILIPTDGSDHSMRAAEYGVGIAKILDAQIISVFVIDDVVIREMSKMNAQEDVESELKENGQGYIKYIQGLASKEGVKASSFLARGTPFEQIVHLAKELGIDLIVMGTYGRRGAERILIGSVTQRVIEYAQCPVLVIK